jgi:hypothetical protein
MVVTTSGHIWERLQARREYRSPAPLFHSALEVSGLEGNSVIEIAPAVNSLPANRGVVGEGPVGAAWAGRFRIFRYELRCWRQGKIPDLEFEPGKPVVMSRSSQVAETVIHLTREVPMLTWGRDELRLGEMWNSNSVIAWLLSGAGADLDGVTPPDGGRAPGWDAGIEACRMSPPAAISRRS